jgi:hypothetical protein
MSARCSSQKELEAIWKKHRDGDDLAGCPEANFDSCIVVTLFVGASDCLTWFFVHEVIDDGEALRVRVRATGPQTTGPLEP